MTNIHPVENAKSELTYDQLMCIWAPIYDIARMLEPVKPAIIAVSSETHYQNIIDKLDRAQEPLIELIKKVESENPSAFGPLDS